MFRKEFDMFGDGGPAGPEGFGPHFGRRMRAGRGMMEPAILQVLLDKPMHGYEIITTLEERFHGMWRPSAGSVYPTLQLLEEKEHLTSSQESGKKVYTLTDAGRQAAEEMKDKHEAAWKDRVESLHGMHDFRKQFGQSMHAMHRIVRSGSDEQKEQLKQAIDDFAKALERIGSNT